MPGQLETGAAVLTWRTSGWEMPSKVTRSPPPSRAEPSAGAHQAPNSVTFISVPNTFCGVAAMLMVRS